VISPVLHLCDAEGSAYLSYQPLERVGRVDSDDSPPPGVATWGPTSRPVPQWTRPGATPVGTLGRQGHHH
jgi:hypothetical protein